MMYFDHETQLLNVGLQVFFTICMTLIYNGNMAHIGATYWSKLVFVNYWICKDPHYSDSVQMEPFGSI